MIVDCISDLHGYEPEMPGGDLLIVAGDMTGCNEVQWIDFFAWLRRQEYEKKVIIGGNHDGFLEQCASRKHVEEIGLRWGEDFDYLCDTGCEFGGFKIWGSPWTKTFSGINPDCTAFTLKSDRELAHYWDKIPDDTDILVTHSPPYCILDKVRTPRYCISDGNSRDDHVGSISLRMTLSQVCPRLHVFGHIHESYGQEKVEYGRINGRSTVFVNASHVDRDYEPVNKPIRVIL